MRSSKAELLATQKENYLLCDGGFVLEHVSHPAAAAAYLFDELVAAKS